MSVLAVPRPRRVAAGARHTFRSLRQRNYRLWFIGQTISQSGTWMQAVGLGAFVRFSLHGSGFELGVTAALQFGPVLFLGPFGGLLADRFDKRKVMFVTQAAFTIQALALGLLVAAHAAPLRMVWALAFVMGVINSADNPARQAFAVEMAGRDEVANAVALNSVIVNSSRIVGPALAGILLAATHKDYSLLFLLNAASFGAVIYALAAMRPAELLRAPSVRRAKGQIRAGLRYAWSKWELRVPLLMMAVLGTLAYNFSVLLPLLTDVAFHRPASTLGALTTAMGIGALPGALIVASRRRTGYRQLVVATIAFGVFTIAVAYAPTLPLELLLLVPMGAASVAFIATANSLLQLHSRGVMRGRVMALWSMVFLGTTPIGAPLMGFVAGRIGPRDALAIGGGATLLAAAGAALALRRIRESERADAEAIDADAPSYEAEAVEAEASRVAATPAAPLRPPRGVTEG